MDNDANAVRALLWAILILAAVVAAGAFVLYTRLRAIHHSLRNVEHYAKTTAHLMSGEDEPHGKQGLRSDAVRK